MVLACVWLVGSGMLSAGPIRLHPENPHYLEYQGKACLLITSAEHYGAVLNADFDYERYLRTLKVEGMNYTRIFTGSYVETRESFDIGKNTLAPAVGAFLSPWVRVDEPAGFPGENKVDLSRWNPEYFQRLTGFVGLAESLDIIVEVTLFSSTYEDPGWVRNPFNPANNVNRIDPELKRQYSNTLDNGGLLKYQHALTEKVVRELNRFDNVFFEIQNEPWSDDPREAMRILKTLDPDPGRKAYYKWAEVGSEASLAWQRSMAQVVVETEASLDKKHLIAQNYANFWHSISEVDPHVSILNFHYAWPRSIWENYGWNRAVGFDESGFYGNEDATYLRQAWQFMLSGGAIFNNLDYSFYVGTEDGSGTNDAPGGGSRAFREGLVWLRDFIESFDFVRMRPDRNVVHHAPGLEWQGISEEGRQYALVFSRGIGGKWVDLNLPSGDFYCELYLPLGGTVVQKANLRVGEDEVTRVRLPRFEQMIAMKIFAAESGY